MYLASQNIPSAIVLTLVNKGVLYCISYNQQLPQNADPELSVPDKARTKHFQKINAPTPAAKFSDHRIKSGSEMRHKLSSVLILS